MVGWVKNGFLPTSYQLEKEPHWNLILKLIGQRINSVFVFTIKSKFFTVSLVEELEITLDILSYVVSENGVGV